MLYFFVYFQYFSNITSLYITSSHRYVNMSLRQQVITSKRQSQSQRHYNAMLPKRVRGCDFAPHGDAPFGVALT